MKLVSGIAVSSLVLVASSLRAQEAIDPWSLIPHDAVCVAWCDGPAKLREAFADTRVLHALTGPEMSSRNATQLAGVCSLLERALTGSASSGDELTRTFTDYGGRMIVAFGFDMHALAEKVKDGVTMFPECELVDAGFWWVGVLAGDGTTDLARLATSLEESAAQDKEARIEDLRTAGRTLRVRRGRVDVTLPFVEGKHLVVVGAHENLDAAVERCLAPGAKSLLGSDLARSTASAGAWIDAHALFQMTDDLLEGNDDAEEIRATIAALGFDALGALSCRVEPVGVHAMLTWSADLRANARGLLAALLPLSDQPLTGLDLVPMQSKSWWVWRIDFRRLYDTLGEVADIWAEKSGQTRAQLEDEFADSTQVRLKEDLIAHLGDQVLAIAGDAASAAADPDSGPGSCVGVLLDDPKAFGASFEKLVRASDFKDARKSDDYRGFAVQRVAFGPMVAHYAVSERALLIAWGDEGLPTLRAVLDEERDRKDGKPHEPLPAAVKERTERTPHVWSCIVVESVAASLAAMRAAASGPFVYLDFGEGPEMATSTSAFANQDTLGLTPELFERYGLDACVSVFRSEPRRMSLQMIW